MAIKTFKRYELKYILDTSQYKAVLEGIVPYVNVQYFLYDFIQKNDAMQVFLYS